MDILVSSNLERLLYHLSKNNADLINEWFSSLAQTGKFEVDKKMKTKLKSLLCSGWCDDKNTAKTIAEVFNKYGYLMDTHTAVGYKVWQDYTKSNPDDKTKTIIVSTASPYKFGESVYQALYGKHDPEDATGEGGSVCDGDFMKLLEERTGIPAPKPLAAIADKPVRFDQTLRPSEIKDVVLKMLS